MNYNIKGTGLEVSDEIRTYVEKRFAHIEKFLEHDSTAHTDVEVSYHESESGEKYRAEFTTAASGDVFRAEATGEALHEAIDKAVGELSEEIKRRKEKRQSIMRRGASRFKDIIRGFRSRE